MPGNTIGERFKLTTFGESHGTSIGGVLDGMPAGVQINPDRLQAELDRRRPGQSNLTTARKESDTVTLLSGVFEGRTTGTPIGFTIPNGDAKPADYNHLEGQYRPVMRTTRTTPSTAFAITAEVAGQVPEKPQPALLQGPSPDSSWNNCIPRALLPL